MRGHAVKTDLRDQEPLDLEHLEVPDRRDADDGDPAPADPGADRAARVELFAGLYGGPSVQRRASGGGAGPVDRDRLVPSGGGALPEALRAEMEARFGADFSGVRIHVDDAATEALGAEAYTVGSDVVFSSARWAPQTPEGVHLVAHELTHVLQQARGAVDGTELGDGVRVSDPSDRFEQEAEATAARVSAGESVGLGGAAGGGGGASVQRKGAWDRAKKAFSNPFKSICEGVEKGAETAGQALGTVSPSTKEAIDKKIESLPEEVKDGAGVFKQMLCGELGGIGAGKEAAKKLIETGSAKEAARAALNSCATNDESSIQKPCIEAQLELEKRHGVPDGQKPLADKLRDGELKSAQATIEKKNIDAVDKAKGNACEVSDADIDKAIRRDPKSAFELSQIRDKGCPDKQSQEPGGQTEDPGVSEQPDPEPNQSKDGTEETVDDVSQTEVDQRNAELNQTPGEPGGDRSIDPTDAEAAVEADKTEADLTQGEASQSSPDRPEAAEAPADQPEATVADAPAEVGLEGLPAEDQQAIREAADPDEAAKRKAREDEEEEERRRRAAG